jgi:hypothetical protein
MSRSMVRATSANTADVPPTSVVVPAGAEERTASRSGPSTTSIASRVTGAADAVAQGGPDLGIGPRPPEWPASISSRSRAVDGVST